MRLTWRVGAQGCAGAGHGRATPAPVLPASAGHGEGRSLRSPVVTLAGDAARQRAGAFVRALACAAYPLAEEARMIPAGKTGDMPHGTKPAAWDTLRADQQ